MNAISLESSGRGPVALVVNDDNCRKRVVDPEISPSMGKDFSADGSMPAFADWDVPIIIIIIIIINEEELRIIKRRR